MLLSLVWVGGLNALVGGLWYGVCGGLLLWCLFWFDVGLWLVVLRLVCGVVYGLLLYVGVVGFLAVSLFVGC